MGKTFDEIKAELSTPLNVSRVRTRKDAGSDVPYLEGHDVITRANEIFDYQWSFHTTQVSIERWDQRVTQWSGRERRRVPVLDEEGKFQYEPAGIVWVTGEVRVLLDGIEYTHGDLGRSPIEGDSPKAIDTALAGATTDCMKRCFRQLGDQFGNSLYDKEFRETELGGVGYDDHQDNGGNQRPANGGKKQQSAAVQAPAVDPAALEEAKKFVVPDKLPLSGKTLDEALKDGVFGHRVVSWFAGIGPNSSKQMFVPTDASLQEKYGATAELLTELQNKAKLVLPTVPAPQK